MNPAQFGCRIDPLQPAWLIGRGHRHPLFCLDLRAPRGRDARPGLGEVHPPTVFVLGADNPLRPRHNIAAAALMLNATYHIESTGHMVWMERPGAVRHALDNLAVAEE